MDLNNPNRLYIALGIAGLLLIAYAGKIHLDNVIAQADGQVKLLKQREVLFQEEARLKNKELEAANFRYDALAREATRLAGIAHRIPTPPEVPPTPETAEELTVSLRVALSQQTLVVNDPNQSTILNKQDGEKVFVMFEEAKRIPGFESKVAAQEVAITSLETTLKAAGDRFSLQGEALSLAGTRLDNCQQETKILAKEVSQTKTRGRLQKILWGASGLAVGFLAARK